MSEGHGDFDELGLWFLRVEAAGGGVSEAVMEAMNGTLHLGIWIVNFRRIELGIFDSEEAEEVEASAWAEGMADYWTSAVCAEGESSRGHVREGGGDVWQADAAVVGVSEGCGSVQCEEFLKTHDHEFSQPRKIVA